eukprot:3085814-Amphidinium_carterae.1
MRNKSYHTPSDSDVEAFHHYHVSKLHSLRGHGPLESPVRLEYDRILADVPCSGDGTIRKNAQVWRSWGPREALALHSLQKQILLRALYLLAPGGVVVYSTCSLNPVENEAVVLAALRRWKDTEEGVQLLDAHAQIRQVCDLKSTAGLTTWVVPAPARGNEATYSSW